MVDRLCHAKVEQRANCLYIHTHRAYIETDTILTLSLMLFRNHNSFEVTTGSSGDKGLVLFAGVYDILAEYIMPGETVEFEIPD